ncbi:MAG: excinuclease ABC subunit C, partial [Bacteroidetes bacterium HGW-Bacteroidetes-21]
LIDKVPIISIAKRLEEIYRPGDDIPLMLDKKSPSLKLIQQLRDEAHRFGITFHRKVRDKKSLKMEIENIKGIGNKTIQKVYARFGSLKNIQSEQFEALEELIGKDKADKIRIFLKK